MDEAVRGGGTFGHLDKGLAEGRMRRAPLARREGAAAGLERRRSGESLTRGYNAACTRCCSARA